MIKFALRDERGAIVSDWVALSAGLFFLGVVVVSYVMEGARGLIDDAFGAHYALYGASADEGGIVDGLMAVSADKASGATLFAVECRESFTLCREETASFAGYASAR